MTIRPYDNKDKDAVHNICLYCDGPEDFSEEAINFLLSTYCDYYIEMEPHNCFVAVDENDTAVGYIICTEDFDKYISQFKEQYITRIPEEETKYRIFSNNANRLHEKYKDIYPAHLHIDILPEYQRMGIGHLLMDKLLSHLNEKRIRGVMLDVASFNEKGIAFYKKYGFNVIEESPDGIAFGKKLQ